MTGIHAIAGQARLFTTGLFGGGDSEPARYRVSPLPSWFPSIFICGSLLLCCGNLRDEHVSSPASEPEEFRESEEFGIDAVEKTGHAGLWNTMAHLDYELDGHLQGRRVVAARRAGHARLHYCWQCPANGLLDWRGAQEYGLAGSASTRCVNFRRCLQAVQAVSSVMIRAKIPGVFTLGTECPSRAMRKIHTPM